MRKCKTGQFAKMVTQKEITSHTDKYLVILSSKTYVFEDKLSVSLIFSVQADLSYPFFHVRLLI